LVLKYNWHILCPPKHFSKARPLQKINSFKTEHDKAFENLEKQGRKLRDAKVEFLSEFGISPIQLEVLWKLYSAGGILISLDAIKETCAYFQDFNLLMLKGLESKDYIGMEYDSFGVPKQARILSLGSVFIQEIESRINPKIEKHKALLTTQEAKILNLLLNKLK
jgi:DNA-binding MarR family transcriptional regulator